MQNLKKKQKRLSGNPFVLFVFFSLCVRMCSEHIYDAFVFVFCECMKLHFKTDCASTTANAYYHMATATTVNHARMPHMDTNQQIEALAHIKGSYVLTCFQQFLVCFFSFFF